MQVITLALIAILATIGAMTTNDVPQAPLVKKLEDMTPDEQQMFLDHVFENNNDINSHDSPAFQSSFDKIEEHMSTQRRPSIERAKETISSFRADYGYQFNNGENVNRINGNSFMPGQERVDSAIIGAGVALDQFFNKNISQYITPMGADVLDTAKLQITTALNPKALEGIGRVGPLYTCSTRICAFFQKKMSNKTYLQMYASPELFKLHVLWDHGETLEISKGIKLRDAQFGIIGSIGPMFTVGVALEIGGMFDLPRPAPMFGEGSDIGFGVYVLPGLKSITVDFVGRGTWKTPFGMKMLHLRNLDGSMTMSYAGVPGGTGFGATVYLGHENEDGELTNENTIEFKAYVDLALGADAKATSIFGSISELSIHKLFQVLSRRPASAPLPTKVLGFTIPQIITGTGLKDVTISAATSETGTRWDAIPGGIRFQAQVNVLGYDVRTVFLVQVVYGFPVHLMMDFELGPVDMGPILQITRAPGSKLGPKVYAEVGLPKTGVYIEGYVQILGVGVHAVIAIDLHNAYFEVQAKIFNLIQATVTVAATDVNFRNMRTAQFVARAELDIEPIGVQFKALIDAAFVKPLQGLKNWFKKTFRKKDKHPMLHEKTPLVEDESEVELEMDPKAAKEIIKALKKLDVEVDEQNEAQVTLIREIATSGDTSFIGIQSVAVEFSLSVENTAEFMAEVTYFSGRGVNRKYDTKSIRVNLKDIAKTAKNILKAIFSNVAKFFKRIGTGFKKAFGKVGNLLHLKKKSAVIE